MQEVLPVSGAHVPCLTVAGHFLSMQPTMEQNAEPKKIWFRGDEYAAVVAERDKYKMALEASRDRIEASMDPCACALDVFDIVEAALE